LRGGGGGGPWLGDGEKVGREGEESSGESVELCREEMDKSKGPLTLKHLSVRKKDLLCLDNQTRIISKKKHQESSPLPPQSRLTSILMPSPYPHPILTSLTFLTPDELFLPPFPPGQRLRTGHPSAVSLPNVQSSPRKLPRPFPRGGDW